MAKSMYERLQELKYYNPGDEASELFETTCRLVHEFYGFGDPRAEIVFEWAKEQAESSKKWSEENGYTLDDYITGICL